MNERRATTIAVAIALTAAAIRLIPLQWLHPLNWDEIEFYRATRWIAEGRVPFRDFWEHHSPLAWFVFAPFARLTDSPGAGAILAMRWAQIPVWIAAFWLANVFMRNAGLSRFARWASMAVALSSSFLMIAAVEYRVDPLACALYLGGLVLWSGGLSARRMFFTGVCFCLAGLTNIRLGPLLVITVLLLSVVGKPGRRALRMYAGGAATLGIALLGFVATHSFDALVRQVVVENYIGDKYAEPVAFGFIHRLLIPFGVRVIASDRLFELAAVDAGGIALLVLGFTGLVLALKRWREPDALFVMALLQAASLIVIAAMNFVYNYHFEIVVLMMLPLIALVIDRMPLRGVVLAILAVAWSVNAFASIFRGKELDLAYQDFVMREVHARTRPGERVWAGIPWALRREPAYRFWFLPDMTRHLVLRGYAPPYALRDVLRDPPAALVVDHYALVWMATVQRELAPYFVRHYIPVWRNVWIPGMNARLQPGASFEWIVPRDGTYRVFASPGIAAHIWFSDPLYVAAYDRADPRVTLTLPPPRETRVLKRGERIRIANSDAQPLGIFLIAGADRTIFRHPPPGATLEAATTRVTHVPQLGVRIRP